MRRVEEVIYIVPERREAFLNRYLNPTDELQRVMWRCGIRNQFFYDLNGLILQTFEYKGKDFKKDMSDLTAYYNEHEMLVTTRRRDVPADQLDSTDWWAPLKILGSNCTKDPTPETIDGTDVLNDGLENIFRSYGSGAASDDLGYDDDDWSESIHF